MSKIVKFTTDQIDHAIEEWFGCAPLEGSDYQKFRERMEAAIRAALKEPTK